MHFVRTLVEEKTGLRIDQPDSRGGTSSTGNVARHAFSDQSNYMDCILSIIEVQYRDSLLQIHANIFYPTISKLESKSKNKYSRYVRRKTYIIILESFPWASITPTLHKIFAHSEELIRDSNSCFGLKNISEEGTEACNKLNRKYRKTFIKKD